MSDATITTEGHSSVADSGLEGSAVDQPAPEAVSLSSDSITEDKRAGQGTRMSANEMEGTITRTAIDRRGSDDSDDGNPEERRGSDDSLAAEGISMEKQDVETKEKPGAGLGVGGAMTPKSPVTEQSGRGGYSVVGGAGSGERRSSSGKLSENSDRSPAVSPDGETSTGSASNNPDQEDVDEGNQGLPFVAPITLEVGQVMFAPAPPPVSTAMPLLRSRSKEDESKEEGAPQPEVVEDIHEKYFDAVQLQDSSVGLSESGGEKDKERPGKREYTDAEEDADDEHVSSVSEGEEDRPEKDIMGEQNIGDDDTFPLRTYRFGRFHENDLEPSRDRLEERRLRLSSGDGLSVSSTGQDDGGSSVISDGYSPRMSQYRPPPDMNSILGASEADERAAQSYNRFKASMPKFSSKAYSFSKRNPSSTTTVTAANTTGPLTFDHLPLSLLSPGSQLYSADSKITTGEDDAMSDNDGDGGGEGGGNNNINIPTVPHPPPPTPRAPYDGIKVDKSEGYYLDNYSDVCTWRMPSRDSSRPYLNGALDETLEDLLEKMGAEETKSETNLLGENEGSDIDENEDEGRRDEDGEGVVVEDEDGDVDDAGDKGFGVDDDETREMEVKNKDDETAKEKVRLLLRDVCVREIPVGRT